MTGLLTGLPCLRDATSIHGLGQLVASGPDWQRTLKHAFRERPPLSEDSTVADVLRHDHVRRLCRGGRGSIKRNRSVGRHVVDWWGDVRPATWTNARLLRELQRYLEAHEHRPNEQSRRATNLMRRAVYCLQSEVLDEPRVSRRGPVDRERAGAKARRPMPALEAIAEVLEYGGDEGTARARQRIRAVQVALVLALASGLRTSELLALRARDLDLRRGILTEGGEAQTLPPWAVAQLRLIAPRAGPMFPSPRDATRARSDLAGLLRQACKRAAVTPFTLRDVRRVWQREGRAVGLPRATVRGSADRLGTRAGVKVTKGREKAQRTLVTEWTAMVHGPADARGMRRVVPKVCRKGVRPHEPELPGRVDVRRPRVAARCRSNAVADRPTTRRRPATLHSAMRTHGPKPVESPTPMVPTSSVFGPPPTVVVRQVAGPPSRWEHEDPADFARKSDLLLALSVGVLYREARVLIREQKTAKSNGQDLLLAIGAFVKRAEELLPEIDEIG